MWLNDKDARTKNRNCRRSLKKKIGGSITLPLLVHTIRKQLQHGHGEGISYKEYDVTGDLKKYASKSLQLAHKRAKGKKIIRVPKIATVQKTGGALPLILILAGIVVVKTIAGGVDTIVNTVKNIVDAKRKIFPGSKETVLVGKGLFLSSRKKGYGHFLDSVTRGYGLFLNNSKN